MAKLKFKKRTYESSRQRAEQTPFANETFIDTSLGVDLYRPPKSGDFTFRILPATWDNADHYGLDIYIHGSIGSDYSTFACPQKMKGDPCPICEEVINAEAEGDTKYAKQLKPRKRVLMYIIDRANESEGIKAYDLPWTLDRDIAIQSNDPNTKQVLLIDDPDDGYDVIVTKSIKNTPEGDFPEYTPRISRHQTSVDLTDDQIEFLNNFPIPSIIKFHDYEHMKKVFEGGVASKSAGNKTSEKVEDSSAQEPPKQARIPNKPEPAVPQEPPEESELTWEYVHSLTGDGLDELVDEQDLALDPSSFESDEELADAICEELEIEKPKPSRRTRSSKPVQTEEEEEKPASNLKDRLRSVRERLATN